MTARLRRLWPAAAVATWRSCWRRARPADTTRRRPVPAGARGKLTIGIAVDEPGVGAEERRHLQPGSTSRRPSTSRRALGVPRQNITWKEAEPERARNLLPSGEVDMVIATFSITDERKQEVDFAGPYFVAHQDLLVRRNDEGDQRPGDAGRQEPLRGAGTTSADYVKKHYSGKITAPGVPDLLRVRRRSLANGDVDAVTTDDLILAGFAAQPEYKGMLKVVGKGFTDERYGIGVKQGRHRHGRQGQRGAEGVHLLRRLEDRAREDGRAVGLQHPEPADRRGPETGRRRPAAGATTWHDDRRAHRARGRTSRGSSPRTRRSTASTRSPAHALAAAARVDEYATGELVLDAFARPERRGVRRRRGRVELWNDPARLGGAPDEVMGPGGLFGFSAMLTERSVGPAGGGCRAVDGRPDPGDARAAGVHLAPGGPVPRRAVRPPPGADRGGPDLQPRSTSWSAAPRWSSARTAYGRRGGAVDDQPSGARMRSWTSAGTPTGWSPTPACANAYLVEGLSRLGPDPGGDDVVTADRRERATRPRRR